MRVTNYGSITVAIRCAFASVADCEFFAVIGCGSSISPVTIFDVIAFTSGVRRCRRSRIVAVAGCGFVAVPGCGFVAVPGCGFVTVAGCGFVAVVGCGVVDVAGYRFCSQSFYVAVAVSSLSSVASLAFAAISFGFVVAAGFKFVYIRRYYRWPVRRCNYTVHGRRLFQPICCSPRQLIVCIPCTEYQLVTSLAVCKQCGEKQFKYACCAKHIKNLCRLVYIITPFSASVFQFIARN